MQKTILTLISLLLLSAAAAFGAEQPGGDVISAVESHYGGLAGLTARITQKNYLKSLDKTQTFEGRLWIKKPGKLRIDFSNGQVILVNGRAALFYSKKSREVIKKAFTDFQQMNIPVAFLLGAAHIRDDFEAKTPNPKAPRRIELFPKKAGAAMKKMDLAVDAGRIESLTIFDKYGNTTDITFTDVQEGAPVDDAQFDFKPPKGTEIIEQ